MNRKVVKFPTRKKFRIGRVLVAIILIMAAFYGIKTMSFHRIRTVQVEYGYLENVIPAEGIIVRKELVVKAPVTGKPVYSVTAPRRVRSGDAVVSIVKPSVDLMLLKNRLAEIDKRIEQLEQNKSGSFAGDVENEIDTTMENLKESVAKGDLESVEKYKRAIIALTGKKDFGSGDMDPLKSAQAEKRQIQEELKESELFLMAPFPGMVTFQTDGLEEILTPENLLEVRPEQLLNTDIKIEQIDINAREARIGEPVFKMIDNFEFYIAANLPESTPVDKAEGPHLKAYIGSNPNPITVGVYESIPRENEKLVIFKTGQETPELYNNRKITFKIVRSGQWGILVPKTALVKSENGQGVIVSSNTGLKLKNVKVLADGGDKVVVDGIDRLETVVTNPADINKEMQEKLGF